MNVLQNTSHYCDNGPDYYADETACVYGGGTWENHDINFDNYLTSMRSLFVLSTLEGWPDYCVQLMDGGIPGPIKNNQQYTVAIFFVVFILIGSIICINLFIAIISLNFSDAQEKNKNSLICNEQVQWIAIVHF